MKYPQMFGLLAFATVVLMAFAGTASAQTTSPPWETYNGEIVATSTNAKLDGIISGVAFSCGHSQVSAKLNSPGATSAAVTGLTFTNCTRSVFVTQMGTLTFHSNGEIQSTGTRITLETTILGFPVHCLTETNKTKIGTLTEKVTPAVMHINSTVPGVTTSESCGGTVEWSGTYTVTTPKGAIVVH